MSSGFRMPAEWEPHAATWLAWPHNETDWPGKGLMVEWVFVEMARLLHRRERVRLIVANAAERKAAKQKLSREGVDLGAIDFHVAPTDRSWTRDFLPSFVLDRRRNLAAVKWQFNGWARYPDWKRDDQAGDDIAARYASQVTRPTHRRHGKPVRVVLEGGAIDVDGDGTLLATEQCLLSGPRARNRALGREGTEGVFRDELAVTKVLWLPDGIEGDDTSGHIDDFARFVAGATDARNRKLEIVPLPMPEPVVFAGQRLPASYANFYIANGVVLVPTFNDRNDRTALGIIKELFPKSDVVGVYCRDLVLGLGTLHCSTQQEPG